MNKKIIGYIIFLALGATIYFDLPLFFILFGAFVFYFVIGSLLYLRKLQFTGIEMPAKRLQDIKEEGAPVYQFTTLQGNVIKGKTYIQVTVNNKAQVSTEAEPLVIYDLHKPEVFMVVSEIRMVKRMLWLGGVLALIALAIGLILKFNLLT